MRLTYNRKLDRIIDLRRGLAGNGMHDFILREVEIGYRAAAVEESEACGWSALDDLSFQQYMKAQDA